MKRIFISRVDGGVEVMTLVLADADVEEEVAKWKTSHVGEYASHRIGDSSEVPADRYFRNAWRDEGGVIGHDMDKCRAIHRDKLREARAPKLAALDIEYQRADEMGDTAAKARIAASKQALRDVTDDPAIDAASTPEELKAVVPDALK